MIGAVSGIVLFVQIKFPFYINLTARRVRFTSNLTLVFHLAAMSFFGFTLDLNPTFGAYVIGTFISNV